MAASRRPLPGDVVAAVAGVRRLAQLGALAAAVALIIQACTNREVVGVLVVSVSVSPTTVSLVEGQVQSFTATVLDDRGRPLANAQVEWSSDDPDRLAVGPDGVAQALQHGTARVRASYRDQTGTAEVTIIPGPAISLSETAVTIHGDEDGPSPAPIELSLVNGGGGTLGGLTATVSFPAGEPEGWLQAVLATNTAPTTLTLIATADGLGVGAYQATVALSSPDDRSSPVVLPVTLSLTGIVVVEEGGATEVTEAGSSDTFTVALRSPPASTVVLAVTSTDEGEVTVAPGTLTFTPDDWDQPQTVTVTGVDDLVADGAVQTVVTISVVKDLSDASFAGVEDKQVLVTTADDDVAGIMVTPTTGLITSEDGANATFTVVLVSAPTENVTLTLTSSDPTEGVVNPTSLLFTPQTWDQPQAVTVFGVDDAVEDGPVAYTIVIAPASSMDPTYAGQDAPDVSVTNLDDGDAAGIVVEPVQGLVTTEGGKPATFTVVLTSQPTADVIIAVTSSAPGEGMPDKQSLTFTSGNWSVAQTVTVIGVDDAVADGDSLYSIVLAPAVSEDARYDGMDPPDPSVTNVDDETAGVTVSAASGPTHEDGTQATFTLVLNNRPAAPVTIGLTSSDPSEGSVSTPSVTFTPDNWSTPQIVTVTGIDDFIDDGDVTYFVITAAAVSADPNYDGIPVADVPVTNVDDDVAGFAIGSPSRPTTEAGGEATFTIALTSQPMAAVMIGVASTDTSEGVVSPPNLTFTGADWNIPQTVTVTGVDDNVADGNVPYVIVLGAAVSSDASYSGLDPQDVGMTNIDDETAGVTVSPVSGPTTETGGTATFTVVLSTQPMGDVVIPLSSTDTGEGTIGVASLTFTDSDWYVPQTVVVTGVDDDLDDGDVGYTIVLAPASSSDPDYDGFDPEDVAVTNVDDDVAGFLISPPSGPTTEAGGQATFTVRLTSRPTATVTIPLSSTNPNEGIVSPAQLTFTQGDWNVAQTVTVTGQDDDVADGNVAYAIVTVAATSLDPKYAGLNPPDVPVTNVDDERAGITVSPLSGPTTEAGGEATFTVALNARPSASVTIPLSSSDPSEGTLSVLSLTFTSATWSAPQTVTVTGVDDDVDDDNVVYTIVIGPAVSADANYDGMDPADLTATNVDDDAAGFVLTPPSGPTTEGGGQATFTLALTSEPTDPVTIELSSDNMTEGLVNPTSVVFTAANWSNPRTITVIGQDDDVADGNIIYYIVTDPAVSDDLRYDGRDPADVSITNVDDETVGITVSAPSGPTTEEDNGEATFTVVLNTEPTAPVTIALSSSNEEEGVVSPTSLTFRDADWNIPQVVTVTGQDDDYDDGNVPYTIITEPAVSADPNYDGLDPIDVPMTNVDDDVAGFLATPASGPTSEAGGQATFTLRLTSRPRADVTVALSSDDSSEGVPNLASLTFTTSNWNQPQTVTVTGVDDLIDDDNVVFSIVTAPAVSADPVYSGRNPPDVFFTNLDDSDTAGVIVTPTSGLFTTEAGGTATFTVVLTSEPTANVTIGLSSSDNTEGTPSPTSLVFTLSGPTAWNVPQTVTVTGVDDNIDDETVAYTIITTASSTDAKYGVMAVDDVSLMNLDDDTPELSIADATVTEGNSGTTSATFTVSMSIESTGIITVDWATQNGTATAGSDYVAASGMLTFEPGESLQQTISVTVNGDLVDEPNETINVVLNNAVNADITDGTALGVITDDDQSTLAIGETSVTEGNSGTVVATFTVTKTLQSSSTVTVDWATQNGTATAGSDYVAASGTLTFEPGAPLQQNVTVTVNGDLVDEPDETFTVVLSNPSGGATITDGTGVGTIVDDDQATLAIGDATVTEGNSGTATAVFTVTKSSQSSDTVRVDWATQNGTATAGSDYVAASGTLTFEPGAPLQQTISVTVNGDQTVEGNEVFTVVLSNPVNATISDATGTGTITDDDVAGYTIAHVDGVTSVVEGVGPNTVDSIRVVLTAQPLSPVVFSISTDAPDEVDVLTPTLTFTPTNWSTPQHASIAGVSDSTVDGNQVSTLTVSVVAASSDDAWDGLSSQSLQVTTIDNDEPGFTITETNDSTVVTEAELDSDTVFVQLNARPLTPVTITVTSGNAVEVRLGNPPGSTTQVTIQPDDWNVPQAVALHGGQSGQDDGNQFTPVTFAIDDAQSDDAWDGVPDQIVVVESIDIDGAS